MAGSITRINNNQITTASAGNAYLGINAAAKLQNYSITSNKIANSLVYGSDLTISGNLVVNGTTTTIDTVNTLIQDPLITLADGQTAGTPTVDIGLIGLRGNQLSSFIGWKESSGAFVTALSNTTVSNTTANITNYANLITGNLSVVGNVTGNISFSGNISAGNLLTTGVMSATGNVTGGNVLTAGLVSATGNATAGNVNTAGQVSATSNITGGNLLTSGLISSTGTITATANISGGNLLTAGLISSTGNLTSGNVNTTNISLSGNVISALNVTGNIAGGNITTPGLISATGNITGGNIRTAGLISATGNITGGNLLYGSGIVSGTGNVYASYFIGNIQGNIDAAGANTQIQFNTTGDILGANANFTYDYATNLMTVNGGNINSGNLSTTGQVVATANVTGGNILTGGLVSATGNATAGNVNTAGLVTATGNVTGGNILTGGLISAAGNITTATNLNTPNVVSTANLTLKTSGSGNILISPTTGNIIVNGTYINGIAQPVQDNDAASKIYVDNMVSTQIAYHQAVLAATTANLATTTGGTITYTQPNGASNGVGAYISTTGSFNLIDTANVQTANTRILVKNEGNAVLNGVYYWANATTIVRTTDADTYGPNSSTDLSINDYFFVQSGNVNKGSAYIVDAPAGTITFGTSNITFAQFSSSQTYTGGNGISLYGTVISTVYDNSTIGVNGSNQLYIPANAPLVTPNIGAATGTSLSVTGAVTAGTNLSAVANVITGNVLASGYASATGNITGGNILTAGLMSSTGNAIHGNILTAGLVSATGNLTSGNVLTGGLVSATANITGGNILTAGLVSATGNGTFGNVNTVRVSASGNIDTSANINQTGTGNINGYNGYFSNNVTVIGTLQTTSNIIANIAGIFYGNSVTGNGALYAGIPGYTVLGSNVVAQFTGNVNAYSQLNFQNINNGTQASTDFVLTNNAGNDSVGFMNMGIASSTWDGTQNNSLGNAVKANDGYLYVDNGNMVVGTSEAGTTMNVVIASHSNNGLVATFANTGVTVTGIVSATGNVTGGNLLTAGLVSATGTITSSANITGANVLTGGLISATGTGTFGNLRLGPDSINDIGTNQTITVNSTNANTNFAVNSSTVGNVFYVSAANNTAAFGSSQTYVNAIVAMNATTSLLLPAGTTVQRPSNASSYTGMIRFNTTNNSLEIFDNSQWKEVGGTTFTVIADEQFNGDGSNVAFTLGSTQTTNSCIVSINGIVQIPVTAYSVAGTFPSCVLTFTEAPSVGDVIDVREITTTTTVTALTNNSGNSTITGNSFAAQMDVLGNLIPTANVTYSLGSSTNYWKSLYVGGNTIYLGGLQLQSSTGNVFSVTTDGSTPATLANLTVGTGNLTVGNIVNGNGNGVGNIGSSTTYFNTVFAKATSAQYADLAEKYVADSDYAPGTVVSFGGEKEVTRSAKDGDRAVAGVVSTNPSYIMNAALDAEHVAVVAFTGRVPTSVTGTVVKGDLMVSNGDGTARAEADPKAGAIIGKALENFAGGTGVIEVVIGRF